MQRQGELSVHMCRYVFMFTCVFVCAEETEGIMVWLDIKAINGQITKL